LAAGSCRAAARTDGTASFGAVHTIPPRREPVAYELAVAPSRVCPGGQLRVAVQVHNRSSRTVTVAPNVIVSGPPSAWDYVEGCCERVTVPAHATRTIVATITIPLSTPLGPQRLTFRDYGEGDCCASGVSSSTFEVVTTPA
jgi:hypothetical protein